MFSCFSGRRNDASAASQLTLAKNARMGHPDLRTRNQNRRAGHPLHVTKSEFLSVDGCGKGGLSVSLTGQSHLSLPEIIYFCDGEFRAKNVHMSLEGVGAYPH